MQTKYLSIPPHDEVWPLIHQHKLFTAGDIVAGKGKVSCKHLKIISIFISPRKIHSNFFLNSEMVLQKNYFSTWLAHKNHISNATLANITKVGAPLAKINKFVRATLVNKRMNRVVLGLPVPLFFTNAPFTPIMTWLSLEFQ